MIKGLVIKSTGSRYIVTDSGQREYECVIKGKFRLQNNRFTNPLAVGDHVLFEIDEDGSTGVIREVTDRRNFIVRKASNLSKHTQVIAANIDQALLMVSLRMPETPLEFIDRFLVTAEAYRIPVILVFNKTDIYPDIMKQRLDELVDLYSDIGYNCMAISVKEEINLEKVKKVLTKRVTLLSGNSGVGKSSLLNTLFPSLSIRVSEVSEYHKKGKHTTTYTQMYALEGEGHVIDTPGIKGFGLTDLAKKEIYHFFPEIFRLSKDCRYYNCLHINEPGCKILKAVRNGDINASRYRSYRNIMDDENSRYR